MAILFKRLHVGAAHRTDQASNITMDVTKPYEFIKFGAMDVTKTYEFIWFGAMDVTKPYEFIGFGAFMTRELRIEQPRCFGLPEPSLAGKRPTSWTCCQL